MTRVKVCGFTRIADAVAAVEAGADFLGFNFYRKSPRYVEPEKAKEIAGRLPAGMAVALFVNPTREDILRVTRLTGITIVQLQGNEPPGLCELPDLKVIKAFRLGSQEDLEPIKDYKVWAVLADAKTELWGGSGKKGDWGLSRQAAAYTDRLFLAGGLDPENVAEAVETVRPWAADVCSGVESEPGVKDPEKIKRFIEAVRDVS